jgi:hypothetical protein
VDSSYLGLKKVRPTRRIWKNIFNTSEYISIHVLSLSESCFVLTYLITYGYIIIQLNTSSCKQCVYTYQLVKITFAKYQLN